MFTLHFPAAVFSAPAVLIPGHRSETLKRGLMVMAAVLTAFLALAFALLPASAETRTWNCGTSVTCTLEDDGKFTVSGEGPMTDYSFATYADWYAYRGQIQTVEIEEGVTTVGNNTFLNSARLNSVSIAGTVTSIGEFAFSNCVALESIIFSGTTALEEIHKAAFESTGFKSLTIPASVTFIGEVAFEFCNKLTDITILRSDRRSLKFDNAVFDETGLLQAEIRWEGAEVLELNYDLFFSLGLEVIHEEDGTWLLKWHPEEIGPYNGTLITEATKWDCGAEPDTVTCTLEKGGKFTVSGEGDMYDYPTREDRPWTSYTSSITSLEIGEGVTSIGDMAFDACALGSVSIPSSVTSIGNRAFSFNTNISDITIPASVTSIGNSAFYACGNMPSFTILRSDDTPLEIGKGNFELVGISQAALTWNGDEGAAYTFSIDNTEDYEIIDNKTLDWSSFGGTMAKATLTTAVEEKNYALSVTAPEFDDVFVGYERPEAKPVSIENTGNAKAAITSVKLASFTVTKDGEEAPVSFELNTEAGTTIDVGETDSSTYTVQPVSGLEAGSYTAEILVYYDAAEPASAKLSFKVNEKAQAELQVTLSEDDPTVPQYDVPEGTISETVTYKGRLADGSEYGPTTEAPTEPGEYTVTVTCETADTIYSGSADFTITGPDPEPEPEPEPDHHSGMDFFRLCEDCRLPATGFSALRRTILSEQPKELRYEPVRMHLMLPTLEQDLELVTVPRQGNTWEVTWLGADAGLLAGSALPGEGFSVVAAHNTLNDTAYGPFALLGTMEENDMILVTAGDGTLRTFRVYANELLTPDDMQGLAAIAEENALILVTCENESINGGYEHRRIIAAKPIL